MIKYPERRSVNTELKYWLGSLGSAVNVGGVSYFRFNRYCGLQVETHSWLDMDADPALFHFYAHVGRRRRITIWRRKRSYTQTEVSGTVYATSIIHCK
jgi:hypothetical protein